MLIVESVNTVFMTIAITAAIDQFFKYFVKLTWSQFIHYTQVQVANHCP